MHQRSALPPSLRARITAQHGAFTVAQALQHGMTRSALRSHLRRTTRVADGLYILGTVTRLGFVHAALLRGGSGAHVSGAAAGFIHGALRREPGHIVVWASSRRDSLQLGPCRATFRRGARPAFGVPARAKLEEALLDMASEADEVTFVEGVTRALQTKRTTASRVLDAASRRTRVARRALLEGLCSSESDGIHSPLEWMFQQRVERAHQLPPPTRQAVVQDGEFVDALYDDYLLAVEVDGREFHDARSDARRDNRNALRHGIITLRYTWERVMFDACAVAAEIVEVLRSRGW